jgi:hypothetical protein
MTVKDAIANELIARIDANTFNKEFRVAIDMLQETGDRFSYFSLPNAYNKNIVNYIPSALNFRDTPSSLKGLDKTTWSIGFEFGLTWLSDTEPKFQAVKDAIEEFRLYYVNNPKFSFTVNSNNYNCRIKVSSLKRSGTIRPENGFKRILMNMSIDIISGIDLVFGDDTTLEIKKFEDSTLLPMSATTKQIGNVIDYIPTKKSSETSMKSVVNTNVWTLNGSTTPNLNLTGDQLIYAIATNNTTPEQIYDVKVTPSYGNPYTKKVSIHANMASTDGVDAKINFVMTDVE